MYAGVWTAVLCLTGALPPAEISTLSGEPYAAEIVEFAPERLVLKRADGERTANPGELLQVRFQPPTTPPQPRKVTVFLVDGGRVSGTEYRSTGATASLVGTVAGDLKFPAASVARVLFSPATGKAAEVWDGLVAKESKKDVLVIRKGETVDYLSGLVGNIEDKVRFTLDGEELPVSREKVFGLLYARRAAPRTRGLFELESIGGDVWPVASARVVGDALEIKSPAGFEASLPGATLARMDFSGGKVKYLVELDWQGMKYVPWADESYPPQKNMGLGDRPLMFRGKPVARGLWIHSQTTLTWRLAGDYRRLQTVVGIEDQGVRGRGEVDLRIKGDGKVLFEGPVRWNDAPAPLDLDIAGVRELEVYVGFGPFNYGPGDHLVLGEARLVK
jgi:hypothetical protein